MIRIGIFILSTIILLTAMNQGFVNKIKHDRYFDHINTSNDQSLYRRIFIRSDRWKYGDIYGLCYLPQYKFILDPFPQYKKINESLTNRKLYIIGDSFLADKNLNYTIEQFDEIIFLDRRFNFGPIRLDCTKQNYLIMEFAERYLNDYDIAKTPEVRWKKNTVNHKLNFNQNPNTNPVNFNIKLSLWGRLNKIIFNKDLSRNIELLLFDDKLFTPFKEAKSALNYYLLGRVSKEVAISTDKKRLFLDITVDTTNIQSAFKFKTDHDINKIANNLNTAKAYYQSIGFKEVFLSIIPNSVSIYDDKRMKYNHLLQRVELHCDLKLISLFTRYKAENRNLYHLSDAHWNPHGFDIWIQETNKVMQTYLK